MSRKAKALLVMRGITSAEIARREGVTRTWVSLVLTGKKKSDRIRAAIAKAVGEPVENLWPNSKKAA